MAKSKKKLSKSRNSGAKAKAKKVKKPARSAGGSSAKKVKKVAKKKVVKKKVVKKMTKTTKVVKKVVEKAKPLSKKEIKEEKLAAAAKSALSKSEVVKPLKDIKKSKEELAEERELLGEETYSWDSGSFSDMKNYEPTPVFRKPDPPQPKFKGKKDPRTRYSDKELEEFKDIIHEKLAEAVKDYELLKNTLAHRDEHGTDDTSPTFKVLEDGSDAMSREEIAQLAARQEKHIQNLKNALIRIENKTYGICRVTGKLIPKERLRSVPHATLSIEAKLTQHS
jgi:RNA polymerase-binding transcription factor DksA